MKSIALVSGGIDSAVLLWAYQPTYAVTFDYGQRHLIEIIYARRLAREAGAKHKVLEIRGAFEGILSGLTSEEGEITDAKSSVVPNRNLIMLSIVAAFAATSGIDTVHIGAHSDDNTDYADCRPEFFESAQETIRRSLGVPNFAINAPFLGKEKWQIIKEGHLLGVPFEKTWSCYNIGDKHCGVCPACVGRQEGFKRAGVEDPTEYEVV